MRGERKEEGPGARRYDAFLSYCHGGRDAKLAERLQTLLENYRLPGSGRRLRVFRDNTELPAGCDLGGELRNALERSRYLISVCSEKTKNSKWCMEEIRLFRELHRGSEENLLILLVGGEPEAVIPKQLRTREDGTPLEPLYVDVRGGTLRESLRTLRSEYCKLAAALLGCGLDDLLQRNRRRRRRRIAAAAGGAFAVLASVLVVVSLFACRTWISENQYRLMLANSFAQEGARQSEAGNPQEALANYSRALSLDAEQSAARTGTALLLQNHLWPVAEEMLPGRVKDGRFWPVPQALAGDPDGGYYLVSGPEGGLLVNASGEQTGELGPAFQNVQGASSGWWTFLDGNVLRFYRPETGEERSLPCPTEVSPGCGMEFADLPGKGPRARMLPDGRAVAAGRGMVYLYRFDRPDQAVETGRADLAEAFPVDAAQRGISDTSEVWLSEDGSLAVVSSYAGAAIYDTAGLELKSAVVKYRYGLCGVDISRDNQYCVLAYGNPYRIDRLNPGGMFEVFSLDGTCLFSSPVYDREAFLGAAFCPGGGDCLLVWSAGAVHVWNWREGREIAAPIRAEGVTGACFGAEGSILVEDESRTVTAYTLVGPVERDSVSIPEEWALPVTLGQHYMEAEGPEGMRAAAGSGRLALLDAGGTELAAVELPAVGGRAALSPDFRTVYVYSGSVPGLMAAPVDFQAGTLGEVRQLDTGGETVLSLWSGNDWAAAETGSRELLLFDETGERTGKITPERYGNLAAVRMDAERECVVLLVETAAGAADSFHVEQGGAVEIWDVSSGRRLASFLQEEEIDAAGVLEDGALVWSAGGQVRLRQLKAPSPDAEALAFLEKLGCLTLDERQELVPQVPGDSGLRTGNWWALGAWEKARHFQESPPRQNSGPEGLAAAADLGSGGWFDRCDRLWQALLDGEEELSPGELDGFYGMYEKAAEDSGRLERLGPGLEAYIELNLRLIRGDREVVSAFDIKMLETLAATEAFDECIAGACRQAAALSQGTADNGMEGYAEMMAYSKRYFELLADALSGNGCEAARSLAEFCSGSPTLELYRVTPLTLARLYEGDSQAAAEAAGAWLADCNARMPGNEEVWLEQLRCNHLFYGILVQRGMLDAAVWEDYLLRLDAA